ncbi:hypothetical protein B9Z19DRAFT_1100098 [Tuber borchii]|uniref:Phenylalanyl-tRNA synthetase domain-containing protein n=1 Tax=Tuber borchii TaxID=42251 RepID=A0A2T6ZZ96_TUBBO|nr:hypothetical protein B9Z19DRAFT_1100098 [Tuber borchii]
MERRWPKLLILEDIESCFRRGNLPILVSVHHCFDSLGFPIDHPGMSRTDHYYVSEDTILRTFTSEHHADTFRSGTSDGFLSSADVYRLGTIDRSHYPVFHQMEGARMWSCRECKARGGIAGVIKYEVEGMPRHGIDVEDPNPPFYEMRNLLQVEHTPDEAQAVGVHLRLCPEHINLEEFGGERGTIEGGWVEVYFPFTSPSCELDVFWQGNWLELLGSGVVLQSLQKSTSIPDKLGWAFGVGLEREGEISRLVSFSTFPHYYNNVAFWLPSSSSAAGGQMPFHENDMMEIVINVAGDLAEDVKLVFNKQYL